jgi:hypothetical protein
MSMPEGEVNHRHNAECLAALAAEAERLRAQLRQFAKQRQVLALAS